MAESHDLGRRSERLAADYLIGRGYAILERNYRVGHKEVDLIATRQGLVAFVEVKARAGYGFGHPLEAITWSKRREVGYVARVWIAAHGHAGLTYRFDAIAIVWSGSNACIEHVPNAWIL
jgi:putative endonuclease